jgi:hypothetical protein
MSIHYTDFALDGVGCSGSALLAQRPRFCGQHREWRLEPMTEIGGVASCPLGLLASRSAD